MFDNEFIQALMSDDDTLNASTAFVKSAEANGIDIASMSDDEILNTFHKVAEAAEEEDKKNNKNTDTETSEEDEEELAEKMAEAALYGRIAGEMHVNELIKAAEAEEEAMYYDDELLKEAALEILLGDAQPAYDEEALLKEAALEVLLGEEDDYDMEKDANIDYLLKLSAEAEGDVDEDEEAEAEAILEALAEEDNVKEAAKQGLIRRALQRVGKVGLDDKTVSKRVADAVAKAAKGGKKGAYGVTPKQLKSYARRVGAERKYLRRRGGMIGGGVAGGLGALGAGGYAGHKALSKKAALQILLEDY